jgi:uncharacterized protein (DUF1501 family)
MAFLAGGAIRGGRVITDWPGLQPSNLYQARDLAPTTDLRSVMKGLLVDHLGIPKTLADTVIFPDSVTAGMVPDLVV